MNTQTALVFTGVKTKAQWADWHRHRAAEEVARAYRGEDRGYDLMAEAKRSLNMWRLYRNFPVIERTAAAASDSLARFDYQMDGGAR